MTERASGAINRRQILQLGATGALTGLLAACTSTETPSGSSTSAGPADATGGSAVPSADPEWTTPTTTAAPTMVPPDPVTEAAVQDLRSRLTGTVLSPLSVDYPFTALSTNTRYLDQRPAVIARCRDEADVVTAVNWAREHGLTVAPYGGGHSYAGLSTTSGLLLDIGAMNSVTVDLSAGTASVGAAALNGDVLDKTINTPFLLPGGTCLGVGTGGLVLGGGIGYNTHWAGLTCDHLTATRVVLASGEVVDADSSQHSDLFWACRGGTGGNFGLNTSFQFELVRAPETVVYFRYDYRGADAATAMLAAVDALAQTAPAGLNMSSSAQATPVGAGGPREAIDAFVRGQYVGTVDEAQDLLAPFVALSPATSALQERPFWQVQQQVWPSANPAPHSWGDWSRYTREALPQDRVARMVDLLAECPVRTDSSNGALWFLGWVGGDVVGKFGRTDTAYVHRGSPLLLRPTPVWETSDPASVGQDLLDWTAAQIDIVADVTPQESYQNFPNRLIPNPLQQYFGENLDRLIAVKSTYDPTSLFTNEQGIPVRA
ncbi:FAD-binding oxidoreductase [Nakamurella multipartita]|uniref:FAD linked oxidase domain protein n=1 Tax=Nakamurella multipartita (strain ATCC 700099 / DSM 44233 / CIP 104796 / JCM 9543 / NBRC 105858 / Y-104) TaxID=479431 RepID=C8XHY9_NAKMY|nr:FAD-binding oxidoreductase [Nakamurella multipartita]ACV76480.1 FAD linked oxidase domain protein [Nakamurella multipartita DSM 44233]